MSKSQAKRQKKPRASVIPNRKSNKPVKKIGNKRPAADKNGRYREDEMDSEAVDITL